MIDVTEFEITITYSILDKVSGNADLNVKIKDRINSSNNFTILKKWPCDNPPNKDILSKDIAASVQIILGKIKLTESHLQ